MAPSFLGNVSDIAIITVEGSIQSLRYGWFKDTDNLLSLVPIHLVVGKVYQANRGF